MGRWKPKRQTTPETRLLTEGYWFAGGLFVRVQPGSFRLATAGNRTKEESLRGIRHFLRNFTAMAVTQHLRSEVEETAGPPKLTANEIELVRFIRRAPFDWDAFLTGDRASDQPGRRE